MKLVLLFGMSFGIIIFIIKLIKINVKGNLAYFFIIYDENIMIEIFLLFKMV